MVCPHFDWCAGLKKKIPCTTLRKKYKLFIPNASPKVAKYKPFSWTNSQRCAILSPMHQSIQLTGNCFLLVQAAAPIISIFSPRRWVKTHLSSVRFHQQPNNFNSINSLFSMRGALSTTPKSLYSTTASANECLHMQQQIASYIAGLWEGDGHIIPPKYNGDGKCINTPSFNITFKAANLPLVFWLIPLWGGWIRHKPKEGAPVPYGLDNQ